MGEASALAVALVRVPSPSGREADAARELERWAVRRGLAAVRDDTAVRLEVPGSRPGPTLLFASHLDTVPPGDGWSVDPYAGVVRDGVLVGRGAVDAKGSVAAMAAAAAALAREGGAPRGRLVVLATFSEETRDTTMPAALRRLGGVPDAAVVGEPTGLEPVVAQRGLLIVELLWKGDQVHAGWAAELSTPVRNPILAAARDLARLEDLAFPSDPMLGATAVTPTELSAGVARNVTPPECRCTLDIRTTPACSHAAIVTRLRRELAAEVRVISDRLHPAATPPRSRLLAALRRVRPGVRPGASPTTSDWVWLRDVDALKLGPGDSRRSHTPDERVPLDEIDAAARLYLDLAREYLS